MGRAPKKIAKILKKGSIYNKEYWNPLKLSFAVNQKNTLKRLKEATKCLLETNFENLNKFLPTIAADSYNSALYGFAEPAYKMFAKLVCAHVKNNLLPKLKSVDKQKLLSVLVSTWANYNSSMKKFSVVFKHIDDCLQNKSKNLKIRDLGLKSFFNEIVLDEEILKRIKKVFKKSIDKCMQGISVDIESMKSFYNMLSEIENDEGKTLYCSIFEEHFVSYFISEGKQLIENLNKKRSHTLFIGLIDLGNYMLDLVSKVFQKQLHRELIESEFLKLVNDKQVIESIPSFINHILKNNDNIDNEKQLCSGIKNFSNIFKLIENKDYFNLVYRRYLSKKLLTTEFSIDSEKMVVEKMKESCDTNYTRDFENMFKDLDFNAKFNNEFNSKINTDFEIKIKILSSFSWSIKNSNPINMPPVIVKSFEKLNSFYKNNVDKNRLLKLNYRHGSAEVAFLKAGKEDKILQVDNFQVTVLMLFNNRNRWTVKDAANETKISITNLAVIFQSLAFGKKGTNVLLKVPSLTNESEVMPDDSFEVNDNFTNPRRKIKMPIVSLPDEEKKEVKQIRKSHKNSCKEALKAAIARIMKRNKSMKHNLLVMEVLKALEGKFKPEMKEIKLAVDGLIKRDYIEVDAGDSNTYLYVS